MREGVSPDISPDDEHHQRLICDLGNPLLEEMVRPSDGLEELRTVLAVLVTTVGTPCAVIWPLWQNRRHTRYRWPPRHGV